MSDIIKHSNSISTSLIPTTWKEQKEFFAEVVGGQVSGLKTAGDAIVVYQKALELGIGWANAAPHIHIINNKAAIDVHIAKAILSKPGSGVTFELLQDYEAIYQYTDGVNTFELDTLPSNVIILPNFKDHKEQYDKYTEEGKTVVTFKPSLINVVINKKKVQKQVLKPYDYITTYLFKRKKLDIDGSWINVEYKSSFTWRQAIKTNKPTNDAGEFDPTSAWQTYRKLMMQHKPFLFGAREIASDLLMGAVDIIELVETDNIKHNISVDDTGELTVEVLDVKGEVIEPIKKK